MDAGSLDRRVTFERATVSVDDYGAAVETWAPLATVWAAVTPISDGERWAAGQVAAEVSARFVVRWSHDVSDISPANRLVMSGRVYGIEGVKEIGRREGLEITAKANA